jgi:FecR protein
MKTESNWKGTLHRARVILGRHSLWRAGLGHSSKYGVAFAFLLALPQFALAADKKEANVTEVVRDVRLLAPQTAPRPAVVNETVREGTAVHTATESRAELTFTDLSVTRLGANTLFNFDAATRTYNLGSGAVLISAPKEAGTVRISTAIASAAVSGFTAIVERRTNSRNKFILLHGDGVFTLKKFPNNPCHLHFGQMVISPPNPTKPPRVCNVTLYQVMNARLVKGFKHKLPESALISADIEKQKRAASEAPNQ